MWIKGLLLIILLLLPLQGRTDEILQDVNEDTTPILMERLRKLDKADVWKEDADNSQIELKAAKSLDMQSQQIDNVLDPTAAQDAATKNYIDVRLPSGVILMWSGTVATIPTGWSLCDGSGSTPDLRDKFIVGVKQDDAGTAKTNITGSLTQSGGDTSHTHGAATGSHSLTIAQMPAHTHTATMHGIDGDNRNFAGRQSDPKNKATTDSTGGGGGHSHTISSDDHIPPYYALCFIMKD